MYLWLKYLHILSSTILFGTGIGTACVMIFAHFYDDLRVKIGIYRYVVIADWIFTGTSGVAQILTGLALVYIGGYSWTTFWIIGALLGYSLTAVCWFIVVYLQIKIRNIVLEVGSTDRSLPKRYYQLFLVWFLLGWPAFISLIIVFYLMVFKPN